MKKAVVFALGSVLVLAGVMSAPVLQAQTYPPLVKSVPPADEIDATLAVWRFIPILRVRDESGGVLASTDPDDHGSGVSSNLDVGFFDRQKAFKVEVSLEISETDSSAGKTAAEVYTELSGNDDTEGSFWVDAPGFGIFFEAPNDQPASVRTDEFRQAFLDAQEDANLQIPSDGTATHGNELLQGGEGHPPLGDGQGTRWETFNASSTALGWFTRKWTADLLTRAGRKGVYCIPVNQVCEVSFGEIDVKLSDGTNHFVDETKALTMYFSYGPQSFQDDAHYVGGSTLLNGLTTYYYYESFPLTFTLEEDPGGALVEVTRIDGAGAEQTGPLSEGDTATFKITAGADLNLSAGQSQALDYKVVAASAGAGDLALVEDGTITLTHNGDSSNGTLEGTFQVATTDDNVSEIVENFHVQVVDPTPNDATMPVFGVEGIDTDLPLIFDTATGTVGTFEIEANDRGYVSIHATASIAEGASTVYTLRLTDMADGTGTNLTDGADICINVDLMDGASDTAAAADIEQITGGQTTLDCSGTPAAITGAAVFEPFAVELAAGDSEVTFTIAAVDDGRTGNNDDSGEMFVVDITSVSGGIRPAPNNPSRATGDAGIVNAEILQGAAVSVSDVSVDEGGNAAFEISISPQLDSGSVTLTYAVEAGTAVAADYSGTLTDSITIGSDAASRTQTVTIGIVDDSIAELSEAFTLKVTGTPPQGGVAAAGTTGLPLIIDETTGVTGTATIAASDPFQLTLDAPSQFAENVATPYVFTLVDASGTTLTTAVDIVVRVTIAGSGGPTIGTNAWICSGDGEPGTDCETGATLDVTIAAGESTGTFYLRAAEGAEALGGNVEFSSITLQDNGGLGLVETGLGDASIASPPMLSIVSGVVVNIVDATGSATPSLEEGSGANTFTIELGMAVQESVKLDWEYQAIDAYQDSGDFAAYADGDSLGQSGSVTFAPGDTEKEITLNIAEDNLSEGAETGKIVITMSSHDNVTLEGQSQAIPLLHPAAQATITIPENDKFKVAWASTAPRLQEGRAVNIGVKLEEAGVGTGAVRATGWTCVEISMAAGTADAADIESVNAVGTCSLTAAVDAADITVSDFNSSFYVQIAPGGSSGSFSITAADDEATAGMDADEDLTLSIDMATGGRPSSASGFDSAAQAANVEDVTATIVESNPERRAKALEYVLAAFTRSTVDSVISTVSDASRHSMKSGGDMKMKFAGENLLRGRNEENLDRMTRVVTNLLGMDDYTDQATRERHMVKAIKGMGTNSEIMEDVVDLPDLRQVLGGTDFRMALNHGDGAGGVGAMSVWGQGDFHSFGRQPEKNFKLDGEAFTGNLGVDFRMREDVLVGLALSHSQSMGGIEFTDNHETEAIGKGEVDTSLTSVHPFARWESPDGMSAWGMVGLGRGNADFDGDGDKVNGISTSMRMAAIGGRGPLQSVGNIGLAIKGDASVVRTDFDGKGEDNADIAEGDSGTSRIRVALEGSNDVEVAGAKLRTSGEVGMRVDGGDVGSGAGVDVGANVGYRRDNLTVGVKGSILLAHSDDSNFDQWGLGFNVTHDATSGGRGMKFSVAPTWGTPSSKKVWGRDMSRSLGSDDHAGMGMETKVSYGLGVWGSRATLTPFSRLNWSQSDVQTLHLGTSMDVKMTKMFSFEVDAHHEYKRDAAENDYFLGFKGKYRF